MKKVISIWIDGIYIIFKHQKYGDIDGYSWWIHYIYIYTVGNRLFIDDYMGSGIVTIHYRNLICQHCSDLFWKGRDTSKWHVLQWQNDGWPSDFWGRVVALRFLIDFQEWYWSIEDLLYANHLNYLESVQKQFVQLDHPKIPETSLGPFNPWLVIIHIESTITNRWFLFDISFNIHTHFFSCSPYKNHLKSIYNPKIPRFIPSIPSHHN